MAGSTTRLKTTPLVDSDLVRHRYVMAIFLILLAVVGWFVIKTIRDIKPITGILNLITILLVLITGIQITGYLVRTSGGRESGREAIDHFRQCILS